MWIKKDEYEKLEKQAEHYKNLSGTYRIMIADYLKDIQKLKEEIIEKDKKIKRLEVSRLQNDTSNQYE